MKTYKKVAANHEATTNKLWDEQNKDELEVKEEYIPDPPEPDDHYASDLAACDYESRLFRDPKE